MFKLFGMIFVVFGGTMTGVRMALAVKQERRILEQLYVQLQAFRGEIIQEKVPFSQIFLRKIEKTEILGEFWNKIGELLRAGKVENLEVALNIALSEMPKWYFTTTTENILKSLGRGLSSHQLTTQLAAMDLASQRVAKTLDKLEREQQGRIKSYCTLGLCGGLAMAILLV